MKKKFIKVISSAAFLFAIAQSPVMAQNSKVVSAYNYLNYGELDKAQKTIDEALTDAETAEKPKAWKYKGDIYYQLATTKEDKYKNLVPNAIEEAAKAYMKALQLDTKQAYAQEIMMRMSNFGILYSNAGIEAYNKKDYVKALENFEKAYLIQTQVQGGKTDTLNLGNAALSAELSKNWDKSIELNQKMVDAKAGGANSYRSLSEAYKNKGDEAKAVEVVQKGRVAYPNDGNLILAELDFFLQKGKDKEALDNLNLAIQKDPKNAVLYGVLANVQDRMKDEVNAEVNYKKALELDPKYFDAAYNLGAFYYNRGVNYTNDANNVPPAQKAKYEKLMADADKQFSLSIPYLEKALEINPKDKNTVASLKQLYQYTNQPDKIKALDEKYK